MCVFGVGQGVVASAALRDYACVMTDVFTDNAPVPPGAVAIVGAGLAGLTAARRLTESGLPAVVFDKSRGLGGRLATRRHPAGPFDHGAPAAHGTAAAFGAGTAARRWPEADVDGHEAWVGEPGMSGLVHPLAAGLDIRRALRIDRILRRDGSWWLSADAGDAGPFADVIVAVPAPQAATLLAGYAEADTLAGVAMAPCWTILAAWAEAPSPVGPAPPPFARIVVQASVPGRSPAAGAVVAHAEAAWSRERIEQSPDDAVDLLLPILARHLGTDVPPIHVAAHRWRYARTETPLGASYLRAADGSLLAGGDWALGPNAGDAHASGQAMADAMIAR